MSGLHEIYFRIHPEDIAYVKFVLESYEAVGFMRTVDPDAAIVVLLIVPDFLEEGEGLVASLTCEIELERVPRPADLGDDWLLASLAIDQPEKPSTA